MTAGYFFGEKPHSGFAGCGNFTALIFCPDIQVDKMVFAILVFPCYFAFTESGIPDNIRQADFHIELRQEAVIAHPVGQGMSYPAYPVCAVIKSGVDADFMGNIIISINAGYRFQPIRGRMMKTVGGMFLQ